MWVSPFVTCAPVGKDKDDKMCTTYSFPPAHDWFTEGFDTGALNDAKALS